MKQNAKVIMIQGTMSNVGKSILTTGLCRIFKQDGYRVAPFKSQNMSLNSYITMEGLEMGRAQVVQAEACGILPDVRMNPILLKPSSDTGSQVIVHGEIYGHYSAREYQKEKKRLKSEVEKAFQSLSEEFDIIVIEGAGSPAEINLNKDDFVNMGLAHMVDAPVILVGDIDRGGIFATLYGTIHLLPPEDQTRFCGVIINKFRGDVSLLTSGLAQLETLISCPVLGVLPYLNFNIEEEDSLAFHNPPPPPQKESLRLAVLAFPKISNFTDFAPFSSYPQVYVHYVSTPEELEHADCILLAGSKNTMADLQWIKSQGMDTVIVEKAKKGTPIFGICGGFQMLGEVVTDPNRVESGMKSGEDMEGLGLLPLHTTFAPKKTRTQVVGKTSTFTGFWSALSQCAFTGYEIHMGVTTSIQDVAPSPFSELENSITHTMSHDGWVQDNILGSYVHGLFEEGDVCARFLERLWAYKYKEEKKFPSFSFSQQKEEQYDLLADAMREHLDIDNIYGILEDTSIKAT